MDRDEQPGQPPTGHTLSVLKKEKGKWVLVRDANLLAPVPPQPDGTKAAGS